MISTLLKIIQLSNKHENLVEHKELNSVGEEMKTKIENLKQTLTEKEKVKNLLFELEDLKDLESNKKMDNVLFIGLKIGIEIGKTYNAFEEF